MSEHLLPRKEVELRVGLKRSAIYDRISRGDFPEPVRFRGTRAVRWRASAIDAWLENQILD